MGQDIKDISYVIQNGKTGSSITNILPQCFIAESEEDMLLETDGLETRLAAIASKLNAVYGVADGTGDVFISKINYPLQTDTPAETAADSPLSKRLVCLAMVRNDDNVGPLRKLRFKIDGIPLSATLASLKTDLIALLSDALGFCSDGLDTPRFVGLEWSKLTGIPKR